VSLDGRLACGYGQVLILLNVMKEDNVRNKKQEEGWAQFQAEAAYANSILLSAIGDNQGSIESIRNSLKFKSDYAPAILSMGSIEYQCDNKLEGMRLFNIFLSLPKDTEDLIEIIDKAGSFLIQLKEYEHGLKYYQNASKKYHEVATFYNGIACCAGHLELHDLAISASQRSVEIEPNNQNFVNDLGWSLCEAGKYFESREVLKRAVGMDPNDELAKENLGYCEEQILNIEEKNTSALMNMKNGNDKDSFTNHETEQ